jgi:hypothetical protein
MTEVTTTLRHQIESAPEGVEVFYSVHRELQLLRQHTVSTENPATGNKIVHVPPIVYRFAPHGVLHVKHGQDVHPDGPGGEMQDAVAWLTSHPRLNKRFQWQGHEAGRPLPLEGDYMAAVTTATAHGDLAKLRELEEQEESTHQRTLLLSSVRHAITALESQPGREVNEEDPLPDDWDREHALAWLETKDITVAENATDHQVLAIVRQVAAEEADDPA